MQRHSAPSGGLKLRTSPYSEVRDGGVEGLNMKDLFQNRSFQPDGLEAVWPIDKIRLLENMPEFMRKVNKRLPLWEWRALSPRRADE